MNPTSKRKYIRKKITNYDDLKEEEAKNFAKKIYTQFVYVSCKEYDLLPEALRKIENINSQITYFYSGELFDKLMRHFIFSDYESNFETEIKMRSYFGPGLKPFKDFNLKNFKEYKYFRYNDECMRFENNRRERWKTLKTLVLRQRHILMKIYSKLLPRLKNVTIDFNINRMKDVIKTRNIVNKSYKTFKKYFEYVSTVHFLNDNIDPHEYQPILIDIMNKKFNKLDIEFYNFNNIINNRIEVLRKFSTKNAS